MVRERGAESGMRARRRGGVQDAARSAAVAAAAFAVGWSAAIAGAGDPVAYAVDVELAPVCLEGAFPIVFTGTPGDVAGTLSVETDVAGRLTGTLAVGGADFDVSGTIVQSPAKGGSIEVVARSGKDRITFGGRLDGTTFTGRSRGKGAVAPGKGTFVLDVAGADAQVATVEFVVSAGRRNRLEGRARAFACGDAVTLRVGGSGGTPLKVDLRGPRGFRFKVRGSDATGTFVGAWSARGFGATNSGGDTVIDPVEPPSGLAWSVPSAEFEVDEVATPVTLAAGTNVRGSWRLDPPLPPGLVFDAGAVTISGTPTAIVPESVYTLTAENWAGTATTTVALRTRINRSKSFAPETRALNDDDRRHFLTRTRFGATLTDLAAMKQPGGFDAALDQTLTFPTGTQTESDALAELLNTDPAIPFDLRHRFPSSSQVARWWTRLMVENPNPFQEVLAFFWHDHFAVSSINMGSSQTHYMVDHIELLRREGGGSLRDLLLAVSRDPAMLFWLDGIQNTRSAPNENYAREFWELFTLGVDNGYTQADIVAAARAWSGWRERYDDTTGLHYMVFDPNRHDAGQKTLLGRTIPGQGATDDYAAVVDVTLAERPVAEFVTRKLFVHFCHDAPDDALVAAMAQVLRDADWDISAFLRAMFRSEAFFSKASRRALVKNPVEFGVGFVRTTGLRISTSTLDSNFRNLGQRPSQPPTVNGWPLGSMWLSSQGMADRTNLVYTIVDDTGDQGGVAGAEIAPVMPASNRRSAGQVVDHFAALLRADITPEDRTALVQYLNTVRQSNGTTVSSPFDGNNAQHVDERVRGLLLILAQHPSYHLR